MDNINTYANDLIDFFHQKYKLQNKPNADFVQNIENSQNPLGKTAYYDPSQEAITIFISGRHIKDCLRSLAHELVHHWQNERGDLDNCGPTVPGYAQKDDHMRGLERQAYEMGNMCFRDWEDNIKTTNKQLYETIYKAKEIKGDNIMSDKQWRQGELNTMLMEKWGFTPKENSFLTEGKGTYDLSNADYATGQLEEAPEELEEGDEEEVLEAHPQSPAARLKVLDEKEESEETKLREAIKKVIEELTKEK